MMRPDLAARGRGRDKNFCAPNSFMPLIQHKWIVEEVVSCDYRTPRDAYLSALIGICDHCGLIVILDDA